MYLLRLGQQTRDMTSINMTLGFVELMTRRSCGRCADLVLVDTVTVTVVHVHVHGPC